MQGPNFCKLKLSSQKEWQTDFFVFEGTESCLNLLRLSFAIVSKEKQRNIISLSLAILHNYRNFAGGNFRSLTKIELLISASND